MHMRQTRRTLHLVPWTSVLPYGLGREEPRSQGRSKEVLGTRLPKFFFSDHKCSWVLLSTKEFHVELSF